MRNSNALFYVGLAMILWPVLVGILIRIPILISNLPLDSEPQVARILHYCKRLSEGGTMGVVMPLRRRIRRLVQFIGSLIMTWLAYQALNV